MSKSAFEWADQPSAGSLVHDNETEADELDEFVHAFEQAHQLYRSANVADFLPPNNHVLYATILRELVRVDLEYGWGEGCPKPLEHYLDTFPELKADREGLREIVFEEFRLRQQAGDSPSARDYLDRYGVIVEPRSERAFSTASSRFKSAPTVSFDRFSEGGSPLTSASVLPEVGDKFLDFRLVCLLGKGSFGKVYLARQGDLADRPMVLKVTADRHDESQTLAQLRHDAIVPVYSSHAAGKLRAVCMPYLGSVTLRDVVNDLKEKGSLPGSGRGLVSSLTNSSVRKRSESSAALQGSDPAAAGSDSAEVVEAPGKKVKAAQTLGMLGGLSYVGAVVWMAARLAEGLAHAHEQGILHRDMKPANILLTDDGKPMLLDFNLAADLKRSIKDPKGESTTLGGTLAYMAPEHLEAFQGGDRQVDARSDIYSFGIIMFEMLTGRPPFPIREGERDAVVASMIKDRTGPPPRLRPRNPTVTPAVQSLVRRMLEPNPARRYASAAELAEDLNRQLAHLPLKYASDPDPRERISKAVRRHPKLAVALMAAGVCGIVAMATSWTAHAERVALASAVASVDRFHEKSRASYSLLNAWMRSPEKRRQGLATAREALGQFNVLDNSSWWKRPPVSLLTGPTRERLRPEAGELLLMLAKGEAEEAVDEADLGARRSELESALRRIEEAETCYAGDHIPSAVLRQRAEIVEALGDSDTASLLLERSRLIPLICARDYTLMGIDFLHRRKWAEALAFFEQAIALDSQDFDAHFGAGLCSEKLGNHSPAEGWYATCVALRPDDAPSWFNRGVIALWNGDLELSKSRFVRAAALTPNDPMPVMNLAFVAVRERRYEAAIDGFTRAIQMGSTMTQLYFARAKAKRLAGDKAGAETDLLKGLSLEPTDVNSWAARGFERCDRGDVDGALADYDAALALEPDFYLALKNKAHILSEKKGKSREAIAILDTIVKSHPEDAITLSHRGVLHARLGEVEAARTDGHAALDATVSPEVAYTVACIHSLISRHNPSEREEALRLLVGCLKRGYGKERLSNDHDLDPIRDDPEFQKLAGDADRAVSDSLPKSNP